MQLRIVEDLASVEGPLIWVFGRRRFLHSPPTPKAIFGLGGRRYAVRGGSCAKRDSGMK